MYYNPVLGVTTSNLCGYGNHTACTTEGCECSCHGAPKEVKEVQEPSVKEDTRYNRGRTSNPIFDE